MLSLNEYINEKLTESILSTTNSGKELLKDKILKKWLRQHKTKRIKVEDGMLVLTGKTGMVTNEIHFNPGETNLPDDIKFKNDKLISGLQITGPDLKSIKWVPYLDGGCWLYVEDCDSLEDFDNKAEHGTINIINCKKLKSFSGIKNIKKPGYFYLFDCPSVTSIKDFEGKECALSLKNCGVISLEGYPKSFDPKIEAEKCDNLVSLDIKWNTTPRVIELRECKKLSKIGNCSWPNNGELNFIYLIDCPNVDEKFLEELYDSANHNPKFGGLSLVGTKIDPNAPIVERIKSENPGWSFILR